MNKDFYEAGNINSDLEKFVTNYFCEPVYDDGIESEILPFQLIEISNFVFKSMDRFFHSYVGTTNNNKFLQS